MFVSIAIAESTASRIARASSWSTGRCVRIAARISAGTAGDANTSSARLVGSIPPGRPKRIHGSTSVAPSLVEVAAVAISEAESGPDTHGITGQPEESSLRCSSERHGSPRTSRTLSPLWPAPQVPQPDSSLPNRQTTTTMDVCLCPSDTRRHGTTLAGISQSSISEASPS